MNTEAKKATERLHRVLADTSGLTKAELRRQLQSEGVDVTAFLARLRAHTPQTPAPAGVDAATAAQITQFVQHEPESLPLAARASETCRAKPAKKL